MWRFVVCFLFIVCVFADEYSKIIPRKAIPGDEWTGNWFPAKPGAADTNPIATGNDLKDGKLNNVKMGIFSDCDDGKMNLTVDWDGSPEAYTCFRPWSSIDLFSPDYNINPISYCDNIPKNYWALHACMNTSIEYSNDVPTFGTHRPLWAKYGEYKYLPKQRWLHNIEHGAVVMLYHPCADKIQVKMLKYLVKKCLYRHVITPYNLLSIDRPLALVTWGCRLSMSVVDPNVVSSFIKAHALRGAERISHNGQFDKQLITSAAIVTDHDDSQLCSNIHM